MYMYMYVNLVIVLMIIVILFKYESWYYVIAMMIPKHKIRKLAFWNC